VRQRTRPHVIPSAPGESAGRSVVGVVVLRARSVRLDGRWGVSSGRGGNRSWPGRPPRVELSAVGDAHEVVVPRSLKVQAPEPDFESGWEGVRAAHGVPLGPVLGADHRRDAWWKADLQRESPHMACRLSVRKVVLTLTSKSTEIYLSMAGAKQLVTRVYPGSGWGRTSSSDVLEALYCVAPWCLQRGATSEAGEEAGPPGP
jgi:hypothetical protein